MTLLLCGQSGNNCPLGSQGLGTSMGGSKEDMPEVAISEEESALLLKRLDQLRSEIGDIPEEYISGQPFISHQVPRFDANRFFEVFDLVTLDEGYTLDYVYMYERLGGEPLLYTRRVDSEPISISEEHWRAFRSDERPFLKDLKFEKCASGFFQFAVFCLVVPQFYLFWHALYNDTEFVCAGRRLDELLDAIPRRRGYGIPDEDRSKLKAIDLRPRVIIDGDSADVVTVSFTNWGGFSYYHSHIRWPNVLERIVTEEIVPYDCGIRF